MWNSIQEASFVSHCTVLQRRTAFIVILISFLAVTMFFSPVRAKPLPSSGHLVIVNGVHVVPRNPRVGETVVVLFRLRNETGTTVTIRRLLAGARGPNACGQEWNAPHVDFPAVKNVTLNPGQEYFYTQSRVFDMPGDYFVEPVMQDVQGRWGGIRPFQRVWFNVQDASGYVPPPECLIVEGGLHLSKDVARQGEEVEVEFRLRNNGTKTVTIRRLVAAARGPGGPTLGWSAPHADFPAVTDITLAPGATYTYRQRRSFDASGEYFVEPAFMNEQGEWGGIWPWPRVEFSVISEPFCGERVSIVRRTGPLTAFLDFNGGVLPCGQSGPILVNPAGNSPPLPSSGFVRISDPQIERIEAQEVEDFPEPATLQLTGWTRVERISSCKACGLAPPKRMSGCMLARCTPQRVLFSRGLLTGTTSQNISGCIAYVDVFPEDMRGNISSVSFFAPLRNVPLVGSVLDTVPVFLAEKWAVEVTRAVNGEQSFADVAWTMFVDLAVDAGAKYTESKLVGDIWGIHIDLSKEEAFKDFVVGPVLDEMTKALEESGPAWVAWYEGNHRWPFATLPHCIDDLQNCYPDYRTLLKEYPRAYQYIYDYKIVYCALPSEEVSLTPEEIETEQESQDLGVVQFLERLWAWLRRLLAR